VGDIFGAPLAIEGIMAFFMESTFIAIMFFGWDKVSKRFHLTATWLTAFGANLSALWILVANGWMQFPAGMHFNPDTARNEMVNFWEVLFSPVAINKFLHTVTSSYVLASIFVVGISAWFLLRKRNEQFAKRSIIIASVFGLISSVYLVWTGDGSAYQVAQKQPMKLAAMEGLYEGKEGAGLIIIGMLTPNKDIDDNQSGHLFKIEMPGLLSFLGHREVNAFVPGVKDIVNGGYPVKGANGEITTALSTKEKIEKGKLAIEALAGYKQAKESKNDSLMQANLAVLNANFKYFGYGYLNNPKSIIPNIPLTFYSFHIMVALGFWFILIFVLALLWVYKGSIEKRKAFLWISLFTIPLAYVASMCGWLVAEMGRQPWVIQDVMPTVAAVSKIDSSAVKITFFLFLIIFTALLIAEIRIMTRQIKTGPNQE
jgi:cytochrome d ubiquinol oxidase subunit I